MGQSMAAHVFFGWLWLFWGLLSTKNERHGLGCSWRAVSGCVHVAGRVRGCVLPFQVGTHVNLAVGDFCKTRAVRDLDQGLLRI